MTICFVSSYTSVGKGDNKNYWYRKRTDHSCQKAFFSLTRWRTSIEAEIRLG
jgi:hypothetical protein